MVLGGFWLASLRACCMIQAPACAAATSQRLRCTQTVLRWQCHVASMQVDSFAFVLQAAKTTAMPGSSCATSRVRSSSAYGPGAC
jgi:hypothetical protein